MPADPNTTPPTAASESSSVNAAHSLHCIVQTAASSVPLPARSSPSLGTRHLSEVEANQKSWLPSPSLCCSILTYLLFPHSRSQRRLYSRGWRDSGTKQSAPTDIDRALTALRETGWFLQDEATFFVRGVRLRKL